MLILCTKLGEKTTCTSNASGANGTTAEHSWETSFQDSVQERHMVTLP